MTVKIDTILRLLSCLFVFSDINEIDSSNFIHYATNELFDISDAVTSIYFRDKNNKASALFFTYDNKTKKMHVHFASNLKYVIYDYDIFDYDIAPEYIIVSDHYKSTDDCVIENIRRILNSLDVDFQNVYYARNLKKFPAYLKSMNAESTSKNKVRLTKDKINNSNSVNAFNRYRHSHSRCTRQPARPFLYRAF